MADNLKTLQGAKISIGTTIAATTQSEFAADTYQEVLEVEDFGEIGDEASLQNFAAVKDGRQRKYKGTFDAGTMTVICGKDPADAGQIALKTAKDSKFAYNFKIELADKLNATGTNTIYYFKGIVASARDRLGTVDNIPRTVFSIAVNTKPIEVAATAGV